MMFYKISYCFCCFLTYIYSFNLFPQHAEVFTNNNPKSYFGFSVLLRSSVKGTPSRLIVGSPRANSTFTSIHGSLKEPGAVFSCSFTSGNCTQFLFDPKGNTIHRGPNGMSYIHKKDHAWLGCSIDGEDYVGGLLVACAPRWINQIHKDIYYLQNGLCYLLKDTANLDKTAEELIPLLYQGNQGFANKTDSVYYYALGEAGMSVHISQKPSEILLGSPGILQWKGMIVKYYDAATSSHGIISQRSNVRTMSFDEIESPNPFYINKLEDFSYFGYAVSSGKFIKFSNAVWYVGGAPRGKNLMGQVLVYEYVQNKNDLKIHFEMNGRQLGEYFGAALAVTDINGDGADDIIVGAPMYSTDRSFDIGCAYVYINNGKGIFSRMIINGPQLERSRYGSAISSIGDINKDGFSDIVIGAPYYNDRQGAVFVYLGNKNGLSEEHSQVILASDVNPNLRGFGSSLSRGADIDNNYYNDIAIGSYLSGHAVVIKTRPVVTLTSSILSKNKKISIDTKTFKISACVNYQGVQVPNTLGIRILLRADPYYKRVFFTNNRGAMWENVKNYKYNQTTCEDLDITVANIKSDFTQPIQFLMNYGLIENLSDGKFCASCPVVDRTLSNLTVLNIPFEIGCGSDNICQPDLKVQAKFNYDKPHLVIGSRDKVDISVEIQNSGEPAFLSRFFAEIPASVSFEKIPNICQQMNNRVLMCNMGNPIMRNERKHLILQLDVSMLSNKDRLLLNMNVTSVGTESNINDNSISVELPLKVQVDVAVIGISSPEQYVFVDENKKLKQDSLTFTQQFSVQNLGPSPLEELEMIFLIPYTLGGVNDPVIKIFEPDVSLDDNSLLCTTTNKDGFYVDNEGDKSTELGDDILKSQRLRKKRSDQFEYIGINSIVHSKMQKIIASDIEIPEDLPLNRTLSLSCISPKIDITCLEVKCISGPLKRSKTRASVTFKLIADLKVLDEMRGQKDIIVISSSLRPVSKYINKNVTYAHTVLQGSLRDEAITKWIIIGSVLGIILLCGIIFGLYKAGFFRRDEHEKLVNEKETGDLTEETEPKEENRTEDP